MHVDALETPIPVVDLDRAEANLARMQAVCDGLGVKLRPHIKTHKLARFARAQAALGGVGITCQKIGEAEAMADAGIDDILISYPIVGEAKALRLAALATRLARLRVALDNPLALETVARAAAASGREIGVLIEFESGKQRTGVQTVAEALALARRVAELPGLRLDGLMTYPMSEAAVRFVAEARAAFGEAGLTLGLVSGGGTPQSADRALIGALGEFRVGTYIYNDVSSVGSGAAGWDDCALTLHVTVVSRPTPERAIIDAGSKSLTSDLSPGGAPAGHGRVLGYEDAVIDRLSEEHGMIDLSRCARRPALGERLRIVPNHVCPVSNLHDEVALARGGMVEEMARVVARGRTR